MKRVTMTCRNILTHKNILYTQQEIQKIKSDFWKRVQKFDNLLLYLVSFVGLITGISQFLISMNYNMLMIILGLIILMWFFPVYYGYYRGAILYDSILERIKGWIFLISGTISYALYFIASNLSYIILQDPLSPITILIMLIAQVISYIIVLKITSIITNNLLYGNYLIEKRTAYRGTRLRKAAIDRVIRKNR